MVSDSANKGSRQWVRTADGSPTLHLPEWDEHYHSVHGALQESLHVFIEAGLRHLPPTNPLRILEMGFGTGLNALLTLLETREGYPEVVYTALEAFPLEPAEWEPLDYATSLKSPDAAAAYAALHLAPWESRARVTPHFHLCKRQMDFREFQDTGGYHLVYFDAFGARVQPELWTEKIFRAMFNALEPGGVLVTYAAKGSVRRAMQAAGFGVERLPGPPGKREMLRATRPPQC